MMDNRTTMRQYMLGAYWDARKESIEQCADRLRRFFGDLVTCDPSLETWYERGASRKQASAKRASLDDQNYFLGLLNRGRHRRDVGNLVREELGFHLGLWNGGENGKEAGLSITCGSYWVSSTPGVDVGNCVVLDLPESLGQLNQPERMARVLGAVARAWEPKWGGVMSRDAMQAKAFNAKIPFVDWMVFVPQKVTGVYPPSSIMELEGVGSIVIVQPTAPLGVDSEEMSRIHRVEKAILR
jgi:immunity protein 52 of polymorphic toxin system